MKDNEKEQIDALKAKNQFLQEQLHQSYEIISIQKQNQRQIKKEHSRERIALEARIQMLEQEGNDRKRQIQENQSNQQKLQECLFSTVTLVRSNQVKQALIKLQEMPSNNFTSPIKSWLKFIWSWITSDPERNIFIAVVIVVAICFGIGIIFKYRIDGLFKIIKQSSSSCWNKITQSAKTLTGRLKEFFEKGITMIRI